MTSLKGKSRLLCVFNILISNMDDHLRNHGFLYEGPAGWRLSPAYDLNPVPIDIKPRVLTTAINEDDGTASLELALSVAEYFEVDASERPLSGTSAFCGGQSTHRPEHTPS